MQILKKSIKIDQFFQKITAASLSVLLLDYDGTLAPFNVNREKAIPYPGVLERLKLLTEQPKCRVIIVSGRPIESLRKLLPSEKLPELWGSHGLERLKEGNYSKEKLTDNMLKGLKEAEAICAYLPEGICEHKPFGLAIHWRGQSEKVINEITSELESKLKGIAQDSDLQAHPFDGGIEIRPKGKNKGQVVETILSEVQAETPIAYLGDDLTDEDAFRVLGNRGLKILVKKHRRESLAELQITPPEELLEFLDCWIKALR